MDKKRRIISLSLPSLQGVMTEKNCFMVSPLVLYDKEAHDEGGEGGWSSLVFELYTMTPVERANVSPDPTH